MRVCGVRLRVSEMCSPHLPNEDLFEIKIGKVVNVTDL